eukprot:CAMPEP_0183405640 /NCGR_PEP_ID=MMETSP0370-20130417/15984_1 /TAXON_ID=268820 /ORGANISM="Peridinium aciculiferum, Strain PAER-2" /LENGTH=43 /DNA_ID= /DNA_START= /DNA_END= /DNA_ORIENTATION=
MQQVGGSRLRKIQGSSQAGALMAATTATINDVKRTNSSSGRSR